MDNNSILHQVDISHFLFPGVALQEPHVIAECRSPYYKHPLGCPNWGHKNNCPPHTHLFLDLYLPKIFIAIARLDFAHYLQLKKVQHPDWSDRALKNPRHWQGHLRASLKNFLSLSKIPAGHILITSPEAMGINVFETCANVGFDLERNPENYVCQVNFIAKPK